MHSLFSIHLTLSFRHLLPLRSKQFNKEQYIIFTCVFCCLHLLSSLFVSFIAQNLLHNNNNNNYYYYTIIIIIIIIITIIIIKVIIMPITNKS